MSRLHVILLLLLACTCSVHGWSIWPFSSDETNEGETGSDKGAHLVRSPVPFEMTGAEERFLVEAKKYMGDLKPLDSCHQIVSQYYVTCKLRRILRVSTVPTQQFIRYCLN